jgi:hypothetical protein
MGLLIPESRNLARLNSTGAVDAQFTTTTGTTITASATPHALTGTPTQIIASTTFESEWIEISVHNVAVAATLTDALLNIYIGAGGSETLLIDSLSVGWCPVIGSNDRPNRYWFPLRIPRGTRISGELRALVASETIEVVVRYGTANGAHWSGTGVETLGEVTASSRGTAISAITANALWVDIGTSARSYRYVHIGIQGNNDTTAISGYALWSIGSGSSMFPGLGWLASHVNANEFHSFGTLGAWCDIASGTAVQMRGWASIGLSGTMRATIHGVY